MTTELVLSVPNEVNLICGLNSQLRKGGHKELRWQLQAANFGREEKGGVDGIMKEYYALQLQHQFIVQLSS